MRNFSGLNKKIRERVRTIRDTKKLFEHGEKH